MTEYAFRLGLAIFGLILVEQLLRRALPHARWGLKPLCVGLAGVFAFDIFFYSEAMLFGVLKPNIFIARGIANALVIPFIAIATARNTGWTLELHMSRGVVFHTTAILVSGFFIIAVAAAGYFVRYFGGGWGEALQIELLFAALLVGMMIASSGSFPVEAPGVHQQALLLLSLRLPPGVAPFHADAFGGVVGTKSPGMLHRSARQSGRKSRRRIVAPSRRRKISSDIAVEYAAIRRHSGRAQGGPLVGFLERTGWVINLREFELDPARYPELTMPACLTAIPGAWLVVPLVSATELVGFVVLATPRVAIEVNWEVLDLLKTASRQAASYLGQIEATEALLEARKFDAFNRMSAFVVHDLKNLVAQLSLMLRNAERHKDNPEFQRDMLATVEHVVGRMNHLMLQLRVGTTPLEKARLTDLGLVVRNVCTAKAASSATIDVDLTPGVFTIGHDERLEHVIGHLVQNALDATAKGGAISVRLRRDDRFATIEVSDTGVGMTPEFVRDRLFKPFQTTKAAGMGIGVYESWQYISGLGGEMLIDSTPNVGTHVRVLLPLAEGVVASAAQDGLPA